MDFLSKTELERAKALSSGIEKKTLGSNLPKAKGFKSENVKYYSAKLTPELALFWLCNRNGMNRKPSTATFESYCKTMKAGRWKDFGSSIDFDFRGQMINGQHTCIAVVKSNTPIMVTVRAKLDTELIQVLDRQKTRNIFEQFQILNPGHNWITQNYNHTLATTLSTGGDVRRIGRNFTPTDSEKIEVLLKSKEAILWENQHLGNCKTYAGLKANRILRSVVVRAYLAGVNKEDLSNFCHLIQFSRNHESDKRNNTSPLLFRDQYLTKEPYSFHGKKVAFGKGRAGTRLSHLHCELALKEYLEGVSRIHPIAAKEIDSHRNNIFMLPWEKKIPEQG